MWNRDRYKRLLRYVYLPDGQMVNELIAREGMACARCYLGSGKYRLKCA